LAKTVTLRAIDVRETDAPPGVEPLHWRLLTTHAIADEADAWCIVDWYRARWTVELFFLLSWSMSQSVCRCVGWLAG